MLLKRTTYVESCTWCLKLLRRWHCNSQSSIFMVGFLDWILVWILDCIGLPRWQHVILWHNFLPCLHFGSLSAWTFSPQCSHPGHPGLRRSQEVGHRFAEGSSPQGRLQDGIREQRHWPGTYITLHATLLIAMDYWRLAVTFVLKFSFPVRNKLPPGKYVW